MRDNSHSALSKVQKDKSPSCDVICRCSSISRWWPYSTLRSKDSNPRQFRKHMHYWRRLRVCSQALQNTAYYLGQNSNYTPPQLGSSGSYSSRIALLNFTFRRNRRVMYCRFFADSSCFLYCQPFFNS